MDECIHGLPEGVTRAQSNTLLAVYQVEKEQSDKKVRRGPVFT